jgi:hypothetical protein
MVGAAVLFKSTAVVQSYVAVNDGQMIDLTDDQSMTEAVRAVRVHNNPVSA